MSEPITEGFILIRCCKCAQPFYMTRSLYDLRHNDHATFFCPVGHSQFFTKSEDQQTNEQLRATVQTLQQEIITLRGVREDVTAFEPKTWRAKLGLKS